MEPRRYNHRKYILNMQRFRILLVTLNLVFLFRKQANKAALSVFHQRNRSFGQLVVLGFDVTVFTPTPYQRCSLQRPL